MAGPKAIGSSARAPHAPAQKATARRDQPSERMMRWGTDNVGVPPTEAAIVCMRERPRRINADDSNRFAPSVDSRVRGGALSAPDVAGIQIPRDNLAG